MRNVLNWVIPFAVVLGVYWTMRFVADSFGWPEDVVTLVTLLGIGAAVIMNLEMRERHRKDQPGEPAHR